MQDNKVYLAVLSASLFGVSMPVIAEPDAQAPAALRSMEDARVVVRVRSSLLTDALVSGLDIQVVSEQGVVYLSGLASEAEQQRATALALAVPGVRAVRNHIEVIRSGAAVQPH